MSQLLRHAALGMLDLLGLAPNDGRNGTPHSIALESEDRESLLVLWLEELLYRIETHQVTYSEFEIQVEENRLQAMVIEVPASSLDKHIKAVTYHNLQIQETPSGLEATIVFDV